MTQSRMERRWGLGCPFLWAKPGPQGAEVEGRARRLTIISCPRTFLQGPGLPPGDCLPRLTAPWLQMGETPGELDSPVVPPSDLRPGVSSTRPPSQPETGLPGGRKQLSAKSAPLSCLCLEDTSGHSGLVVPKTEGRPLRNWLVASPWAQHTSPPHLLLCDPGQGTALSEPHLEDG